MTQKSLRLPRPRLSLSVGIVGHRENKLIDETLAPTLASLRHVYASIDAGLGAISKQRGAAIYAIGDPLVRLLSALASGADRLGVHAAPDHWRIEAVLPMPRAIYADDFEDPNAAEGGPVLAEYNQMLSRVDTVTEMTMLASTGARSAQYALLGEFLVRQVDVLVVVWDGAPAAGPGGTAAVVAQALDTGCLVVWIDPALPASPRLLEGTKAAITPQSFSRPLTRETLTEVLKVMLLPGIDDEQVDVDDDAPADARQLPAYFSATWPGAIHWAVGYSLLRLLGGQRRWSWPIRYSSYDELAGAWSPFLDKTPGASAPGRGAFEARIRDVLMPRSVWADALAWYYGQLYRSAYVTTFLLGGLAVPVGLCYLFFADSAFILDIKAAFATAELLIILAVLMLVRRGGHSRWHRLWLETREMSELLRLGRSLAYVGGLRELTPRSAHGTVDINSIPVLYARATFREIGLPNAVLDGDYLRKVLDATLTTEVNEQKHYHHNSALEQERIDHLLHRIGNACFAATLAVTAIFLVGWAIDLFYSGAAADTHGQAPATETLAGRFHVLLEYLLKPMVSILAAGLPAFGAAFAGIRAQSDFSEMVRRSESTLEALTVNGEQMGALIETGNLELTAVADVLLQFARAMAADVGGWRQLAIQKPLSLPG